MSQQSKFKQHCLQLAIRIGQGKFCLFITGQPAVIDQIPQPGAVNLQQPLARLQSGTICRRTCLYCFYQKSVH